MTNDEDDVNEEEPKFFSVLDFLKHLTDSGVIIIKNIGPLEVLMETEVAPGVIVITFIEPHDETIITTRVMCSEETDCALDGFTVSSKTTSEAEKNHEETEHLVRSELQFTK